ncbi:MAG: glycerol-3-phosphate dehydrogenase [Bacteroidetes bacterium]|nr:MAG: glycerol-3-phosphate dehydrogenase [Bacteroidota bacterium]
MGFGIIGSGSWGTAIAKMLSENGVPLIWCVRNDDIVNQIQKRKHNPNYLRSVYFDTTQLDLTSNPKYVFENADHIVIAIPSDYVMEQFDGLSTDELASKKIISAVKGILPSENLLLNDWLKKKFEFDPSNYFTIMGPCHAEEVASEKLSYLTFSGLHEEEADKIAENFKSDHINVVINHDIYGVQYAAILKNIYALGSGIAHGLEYGDNFLSVLIANCADEMAGFLRKVGIRNIEVGIHSGIDPLHHKKSPNYAASVYLGDLLVTCYSLFSRNRTFGTMIGKGYSVKSAQLEMNMVAEGYKASKCMHDINKEVGADAPILETIYNILWQSLPAGEGFRQIEESLV